MVHSHHGHHVLIATPTYSWLWSFLTYPLVPCKWHLENLAVEASSLICSSPRSTLATNISHTFYNTSITTMSSPTSLFAYLWANFLIHQLKHSSSLFHIGHQQQFCHWLLRFLFHTGLENILVPSQFLCQFLYGPIWHQQTLLFHWNLLSDASTT